MNNARRAAEEHELKAVVPMPGGGFTPVCWCRWKPKHEGEVVRFIERWRAEFAHRAHRLGVDPVETAAQQLEPLRAEITRLDS